MGIHGSDCHKPFPQSDPPEILFVSSGGWGEEYNKGCGGGGGGGNHKSRIFKWNVAEPLQRWKVIRYSIISRLLQGSQLIILRGKLFAIRPPRSPRTFQENGENT